MTEKVGIDEDVVRRHEGRVVLEEHVARHLGGLSDDVAIDCRLLLCLGLFCLFLVCLETCVAQSDYPLDLCVICELATIFGGAGMVIDKDILVQIFWFSLRHPWRRLQIRFSLYMVICGVLICDLIGRRCLQWDCAVVFEALRRTAKLVCQEKVAWADGSAAPIPKAVADRLCTDHFGPPANPPSSSIAPPETRLQVA